MTVNVPKEMRRAVGRLANLSDMSTGEYIRTLLKPALENGIVFARKAAVASSRACALGLLLLGFGSVMGLGFTIDHDDEMIRVRTSVRVRVNGSRGAGRGRREREENPLICV